MMLYEVFFTFQFSVKFFAIVFILSLKKIIIAFQTWVFFMMAIEPTPCRQTKIKVQILELESMELH
jgi:hypothetical protein